MNAAGAWADDLARLAGLPPIGIAPLRRTALVVETDLAMERHDWPMAIDADETLYFKPDAGRILVSPADETPTQPCDAQPDEYDIAVAIDRFESVTKLRVKKITGKWAGLRSFAPERKPISHIAHKIRRCTGLRPSRTSGSARATITLIAYSR